MAAWGVVGLVAIAIGAWTLLGGQPAESPSHEAAGESSGGRVVLAADGTLTLTTASEADRALGNLASSEEALQIAALDRLRDGLAKWAAAGTYDEDTFEEEGRSRLVLDVVVEHTVPWAHVLWILEVASWPPVRIHRVRFGLRGASEPLVANDLDGPRVRYGQEWDEVLGVRLEVEGGAAVQGTPLTSRVTMARTCNEFGDSDGEPRLRPCDPSRWRTSWATYDGVRALIRESLGSDSTVATSVVDIARPQRVRIAYGEVFTVLRALRDEGIASVRFHHRSTELPGQR